MLLEELMLDDEDAGCEDDSDDVDCEDDELQMGSVEDDTAVTGPDDDDDDEGRIGVGGYRLSTTTFAGISYCPAGTTVTMSPLREIIG